VPAQFDAGCKENPHSGATCIKIIYAGGGGWAGLFWQNPANNWGNEPGGYDLKGAKKLVFWARGEKGGEKISEFKIGGIAGPYSDSDQASIKDITLTPDWKEYTIDLSGKDLSHIVGGFCWIIRDASISYGSITFYLDDIYYE